jgi:ABC-type multidrug transport system fused ATPase/permease subunit
VLYIEQLFNPIRDLAQRWSIVQAALASGEKVFNVLDEPKQIVDKPDAAELPRIRGHIQFDNVTFRYNKEIERPTLDRFSLNVQPSQRVAFVGHTGAGKSSVIRLLLRFYDIDEGAIYIEGQDIRNITQRSLRAQMAVVLQETHLFSDTVMNNIRAGREGATDEDVIAAATAVGAHQFICALPEGYQTRIQKGAAVLSVGQRQLLSFARALVADPPILILDEASSNIDTHTEKLIQEAIGRLLAGRTSIIIAHRLSTITQCDVIVVMDHGRIIEQGTHLELLARRGAYHALYAMTYRADSA